MQKSVEIKNTEGKMLRGMLHTPEKITGKVPVVCIFHGFTGHKMGPHFIFVKLSRMLADRGIASVRFDFAGSGESDGDFIDMTVSRELDDAKTVLEYVKSLKFIDTGKIGVLGLSLGGAVSSMLAGDCRDDVSCLCLWAPAGNIREIVINGKMEDDIIEMRKQGFWDVEGLSLGTGFLDDLKDLDILEKASPYDKNVMLIHGDNDETVPFDVSEKYLEIYGIKAVLHAVQGADHTFNKKSWEEEVLDYSIGFLEGELK
ncbi:MAG: alpha/beta hydrolase [Clostridium sp.]|jgi:alpha/beta superfamily hydrolase|uniref:alpha/beta hydrolase family protein n=1 Tax=Clostridium sp. TaxID=1506 RepID=UPI0025C6BA40|nr:alpha/beta hydrolase [Clostridium sp.]MCH3964429.1 alpha/beta hydrolase [Clostridium sp.]MCI1715604.1 alpha/beta hydrolase [Clostridium sp.]MCI1799604.1 alpha/beta hydrolase [Clostridium sp.]MCI1813788.1 alpha/beta hydrolase [Clostridium sp.]MCI1870417.1 alpha/beta hydrolase [Clostridium sp.]